MATSPYGYLCGRHACNTPAAIQRRTRQDDGIVFQTDPVKHQFGLRGRLFAVNHLNRKLRTAVDAQLCFLFHTGGNFTVVQRARQSKVIDFEKFGRQGAASTVALAQVRIHTHFHATTSTCFVLPAL
jgi:hypothetical protein